MGSAGDPSVYLGDQVNYALVDLADDAPHPDPRLHRVASPTTIRAATGPELAAFDAAQQAARFAATSRGKDVLATCALIVRARGISAWNGMTTPQKVTATLAEADVWAAIREFIDDKV